MTEFLVRMTMTMEINADTPQKARRKIAEMCDSELLNSIVCFEESPVKVTEP